jgi:hypothetical protein
MVELEKELSKLTEVHTLLLMCVIKHFQASLLYLKHFLQYILLTMRVTHGLDPIQNGDLDDWDAMIDINVKGLLYVSKAIIHK